MLLFLLFFCVVVVVLVFIVVVVVAVVVLVLGGRGAPGGVKIQKEMQRKRKVRPKGPKRCQNRYPGGGPGGHFGHQKGIKTDTWSKRAPWGSLFAPGRF